MSLALRVAPRSAKNQDLQQIVASPLGIVGEFLLIWSVSNRGVPPGLRGTSSSAVLQMDNDVTKFAVSSLPEFVQSWQKHLKLPVTSGALLDRPIGDLADRIRTELSKRPLTTAMELFPDMLRQLGDLLAPVPYYLSEAARAEYQHACDSCLVQLPGPSQLLRIQKSLVRTVCGEVNRTTTVANGRFNPFTTVPMTDGTLSMIPRLG